jgi:hypothetical protein
LLTAFGGLGVGFFKPILIERYQFMDKIGDEPIKNLYVMIRLDRLSGAVDAFNWEGWQGLNRLHRNGTLPTVWIPP